MPLLPWSVNLDKLDKAQAAAALLSEEMKCCTWARLQSSNTISIPFSCMYKIHTSGKYAVYSVCSNYISSSVESLSFRAENLVSLYGLTWQIKKTGSLSQCRWMFPSFQGAAFNPFQQNWSKQTQGKKQPSLICKQWHWPWLWKTNSIKKKEVLQCNQAEVRLAWPVKVHKKIIYLTCRDSACQLKAS